MARIDFYWDAASPYTYLAATQIGALVDRHKATLNWKPFLLGATFQATGNKMPAAIPAKGKYLFKDVKLWAAYYGVPLNWPQVFPVNSLLAQRAACAIGDERASDWALAVMRAYWVNGKDIGRTEVVETVLREHGFDAPAVLEAVQTPAVKQQLKSNTEEAVARGAFGAPTFYIDEQMFWGNDRLPLMDVCLSGKLAA